MVMCIYQNQCDMKGCDKCIHNVNIEYKKGLLSRWYPEQLHTTANVRFRFLRKILTQISKLTSYIRKRCAK